MKHSVHTLVFRSLKRTHDMFISEEGLPVPEDEERYMQTYRQTDTQTNLCTSCYVRVVYHMGQVMCVRVCTCNDITVSSICTLNIVSVIVLM